MSITASIELDRALVSVTKRILFSCRFASLQVYDSALISLLETAGYTVDVSYNETLGSVNWEDYGLLIIGAPSSSFLAHPDNAALGGYPVHIIAMCRYTSRYALGIGSSTTSTTVSTLTRVANDDPRAEWATIATASAASHGITSLAVGSTLIYHDGTVGRAGVAERFSGDYARIHFGYYQMDIAAEDVKSLFLNFTSGRVTDTAIGEPEQLLLANTSVQGNVESVGIALLDSPEDETEISAQGNVESVGIVEVNPPPEEITAFGALQPDAIVSIADDATESFYFNPKKVIYVHDSSSPTSIQSANMAYLESAGWEVIPWAANTTGRLSDITDWWNYDFVVLDPIDAFETPDRYKIADLPVNLVAISTRGIQAAGLGTTTSTASRSSITRVDNEDPRAIADIASFTQTFTCRRLNTPSAGVVQKYRYTSTSDWAIAEKVRDYGLRTLFWGPQEFSKLGSVAGEILLRFLDHPVVLPVDSFLGPFGTVAQVGPSEAIASFDEYALIGGLSTTPGIAVNGVVHYWSAEEDYDSVVVDTVSGFNGNMHIDTAVPGESIIADGPIIGKARSFEAVYNEGVTTTNYVNLPITTRPPVVLEEWSFVYTWYDPGYNYQGTVYNSESYVNWYPRGPSNALQNDFGLGVVSSGSIGAWVQIFASVRDLSALPDGLGGSFPQNLFYETVMPTPARDRIHQAVITCAPGAGIDMYVDGVHWHNFPVKRFELYLGSEGAGGYARLTSGSYNATIIDETGIFTRRLTSGQVGGLWNGGTLTALTDLFTPSEPVDAYIEDDGDFLSPYYVRAFEGEAVSEPDTVLPTVLGPPSMYFQTYLPGLVGAEHRFALVPHLYREFSANYSLMTAVGAYGEYVYDLADKNSVAAVMEFSSPDVIASVFVAIMAQQSAPVSAAHTIDVSTRTSVSRESQYLMGAYASVAASHVFLQSVANPDKVSVGRSWTVLYDSSQEISAEFIANVAFVNAVSADHTYAYSIEGRDSVARMFRAVYALDAEYSDVEEVNWYVTHDGNEISAHTFEIKFDEGDFAWSGTIDLGDYDDYVQIRQNDPITLHAGGEVYNLIVDGKERDLDGPAQVGLRIQVVSPTAVFDFPRAQPVTKTWTDAVYASVAAQEFVADAIDWRALDWEIPAFRLGVDAASPISVANELAKAIMATVETTREGGLYVRPLYYHTTEFLYDDVEPHYLLDDQKDIFTLRETYNSDKLINRLRIRDVDASYADFMEWNKDENSFTDGELRAFPSPYRVMAHAPVTTTSPLDLVALQPIEEVVWEVEEPELVEIYEGSGNVKYPIYQITSLLWESHPLTSLSFDEGSSEIRSGNEDELYGLVRIMYTTRYHSYRVSGTLNRAAQFLMADTSEE